MPGKTGSSKISVWFSTVSPAPGTEQTLKYLSTEIVLRMNVGEECVTSRENVYSLMVNGKAKY